MIYLHRVIVEDNEATWKIYWFNPGILSHRKYVKKIQSEIYKVFPNETYSWADPVHQCFGYHLKDNIIITNVCGSDDVNLSKNKHYENLKDQNDIFYNKDFICFYYDLDNAKKWFEVYYKTNDNPPILCKTKLDDNLEIAWIAEYYNDKFERTGQNLFITGTTEDIYKWIDKQNDKIAKPFTNSIRVDDGSDAVDKINTKNAFKCEYDNEGNLIRLKFFGCVKRTKVKKKGEFSHIEITSSYSNSINNIEQTEIVESKYDENGNQVPSDNIKRVDDYIFFPKARENGEYERVLLKDM